jgi:hypothetical protein
MICIINVQFYSRKNEGTTYGFTSFVSEGDHEHTHLKSALVHCFPPYE